MCVLYACNREEGYLFTRETELPFLPWRKGSGEGGVVGLVRPRTPKPSPRLRPVALHFFPLRRFHFHE